MTLRLVQVRYRVKHQKQGKRTASARHDERKRRTTMSTNYLSFFETPAELANLANLSHFPAKFAKFCQN